MSKNYGASEIMYAPQTRYPLSIQPISIRTLWVGRDHYENYPAYQRTQVWPLRFKQELIDSVLRNHPIPAIITSRRVDKEMASRNYIVDGQQRMRTIYQYRMGEFTTASIEGRGRYEPNSLPPVEPRKTYQQLSMTARNAFDNYELVFQIYEHIDEVTAGEIFRKLQHHIPLTSGEKLDTYISRAATCSRKLQHHPFWLEMYSGRLQRKEAFQGGFMLLLMECAKDIVNLSVESVVNLAAGSRDAEMTEALYGQVDERLALCQHVFAGVNVQHRTDLIPMYQATIFLENAGVSFARKDQGCLTPWFTEVLEKSGWGGQYGFASPIYRLRQMGPQRDFWYAHLPRLLESFKIASAA